MRNEKETLKVNYDEKELSIKTLNLKISQFETKNKVLETNIKELSNEKEKLLNDIKQYKINLIELSDLKSRLEKSENDNNKLKKQISSLKEINEKNETKQIISNEKIEQVTNKNIKYENEIVKLKRLNENLKSNICNIQTENIARNDLLLKLFKTKVNLLRNQIINIKEQTQRELLNNKKENEKNFELFIQKFNLYIKELN